MSRVVGVGVRSTLSLLATGLRKVSEVKNHGRSMSPVPSGTGLQSVSAYGLFFDAYRKRVGDWTLLVCFCKS